MDPSLVFQRNYSTKSILICLRYPFEKFSFTICLVCWFHILSWIGFLTGTGETSIKHLIPPCCPLIWAVYEIFWMKNQNQLVNWSDTQKIYVVLHGRHLTLLCWYWHSWLYLECSQAEICVIMTLSAWNNCYLQSNHHSPCLHGFRASRCPQHYLSWCFCSRAYALNDFLTEW